MAAKRSTNACTGARLDWARSTASMMRASMVSLAWAVLRTCSKPVPLMVPAYTVSPTALSTGMLSPVTEAWSTALLPSSTTPSSAMRSPAFTRNTAPGWMDATGVESHSPLGCSTSACSGVSTIRALMALRARSAARPSIHSAMAYSAITIAASGQRPMATAPVTATVINVLMFRLPRSNDCKPLR